MSRYAVTRYAETKNEGDLRKMAPVVDSERAGRQRSYMEAATARHRAVRAARRDRLANQEPAVDMATDQYARIDQGNAPVVAVREGFIWLKDPRPGFTDDGSASTRPSTLAERWRADWSSRPPATRLVARRSNAMGLYLTAVYVAHLSHKPHSKVENDRANATGGMNHPSWATLAGVGGGPSSLRARRSRVMRALDVLESARLIDLGQHGTGTEYEGFHLLRDDGTERPYLVPGGEDKGSLKLPAAFFYHGWHLVLEPMEIAVLLAVIDQNRRHHQAAQSSEHPGIVLPSRLRWERYGISGEAYGSIHELDEFGILTVHDPMPSRRRGKLQAAEGGDDRDETALAPVPYRLVYHENSFDRPAWKTVNEALTADLPPRFRRSGLDELISR